MSIPSITPPKPFTIAFPQAEVDRLAQRLADTRLPDADLVPEETDRVKWNRRPSLERVKSIMEGWKKVDVRKLEAEWNTLPHFTTSIQWCSQLHFIHARSSRADAIPLMLIHGWPGSFLEHIGNIAALTEPSDAAEPAFHVVIPSLPGFGFSSPPPNAKPGTGDYRGYSKLLDALMRGLGYDRYAAQGGDWGSPHVRALAAHHATKDGKGCRAAHFNFMPVAPKAGTKLALLMPEWLLDAVIPWVYDAEHRRMIARARYFEANHVYYLVQRDRAPQLSFGLIDSPVGLASWIGFFFGIKLTDHVGEIAAMAPPLPAASLASTPSGGADDSALLDTLTLYWLTGTAGTAMLPYANNPYMPEIHRDAQNYISVPTGYSDFPWELVNTPYAWGKPTANIVWWAKAPRGGHFAAVEEPELFVQHLRRAFSAGGGGKEDEEDIIQAGLWDAERKVGWPARRRDSSL